MQKIVSATVNCTTSALRLQRKEGLVSKESKADKYFRERNDALKKLTQANSTIQKLWNELDERQRKLSEAESKFCELKDRMKSVVDNISL